jgi:hypothetical protein
MRELALSGPGTHGQLAEMVLEALRSVILVEDALRTVRWGAGPGPL